MSYGIPKVKTRGSRSFTFNGAKLWNKLPMYIKSENTKDGFKSKCKDYLFKQMSIREESEVVMY